MLDPKKADKIFKKLFNIYVDLNNHVYKTVFLGSLLTDSDNDYFISVRKNPLYDILPIFIGQFGLLYEVCPFRYTGLVNKELLEFLSTRFKKNVVFLMNGDGFLLYIMLMQTNRDDRISINKFFARYIDSLKKYQYFTSEYDPLLERYKLLWAKPGVGDDVQDIIIYFK